MNMLNMLLLILRVDENIIKIDNIIVVQNSLHDFINISLKDCWGIYKPKQHDMIFKVLILYSKDSLPFISSFYPNPVVSIMKIQLSEDLEARDIVKQLINT